MFNSSCERQWFAVYTLPQNEKSAVTHLNLREVESFLPTYESVRVWKNRQRIKHDLPLFPSYIFVHVNREERVKVLHSPGVLNIVGNARQPLPLEDGEIDFLRLGLGGRKAEPHRELVVGEKVRITTGALQGVEGTLVRKSNRLHFVLTLGLINQHASVEVDADALEAVATRV